MSHVKLHGTLYHHACDDPAIAEVIVDAVRQINPELILIGRSGSELIRIGRDASLTTINEAFADRSYRSDGRLVSRDHPRALIRDSGQIAARVLRM
ncbi:MAG: LamB/YcsF family protein, partial [Phycisphaerae bacterium]